MGFKVVTKDQNGQKVLMDFVPETAVSVEGAELHDFIVPSKACPEPSQEVRKFIENNPMRSLDLHKVVDDEIVCRTVEELEASEWMTWDYNYTQHIPE
jgi:hypothetical protein